MLWRPVIFFSAVVSLQMIEEPWREMEAGADIYLYSLFTKIFARMTIDAASSVGGFVAGYSEGRVRLLIGDPMGAVDAFSLALADTAREELPADDAAWLYGPELGREDAARIAEVYRGQSLYLVGKAGEAEEVWKKLLGEDHGALALAAMAYAQVDLGAKAPLGDPRQAVESAIAATLTLKESVLDIEPGGEAISALLNVRLAKIYQKAAQVAYASGDADGALDYMDRAHWKRKGNKASFVNPPSFIIGLAKAYLDSGQYAPAVDMMFAMSTQFPSTRMAYESLKRLYASKTGGEAPPI
jgi:tetratricopeptide (TPR) repeat protein